MEPFDASAVRAAYDAAAQDYAATFASDLLELPVDRLVLDAFAERIGAGGTVLDLGCGPGQVGHYLSGRGLDPVGVDLAQQMLRMARQTWGRDRLVCGDMRAMSFRPGSFRGVVAFYSVHHLSRESLGTALGEVHRILEPSGTFLVATHLGYGEVYTNEFLGHRIRTVGGTLYSDDELISVLEGHSFVVEQVRHRDPLPHEHQTERIYVTCRRRESSLA